MRSAFLLPFHLALLLTLGCAGSNKGPTERLAIPAGESITAPEVAGLQIDRPKRILFVGNSYFYYNDSLHNHVKRMVEAAGIHQESDLTYKSATVGGAQLRDHNIDHLLDPESLRVGQPFEVVILQEGSAAALTSKGRERMLATVTEYASKVRAAGGEPVLYMTHAYVAPHRHARDGLTEDIAQLYIDAAKRIDGRVIPVGLAFEEAYRRRPDIALHQSFDGSHPNLLGTYLAAATVLASVYGTTPVRNSYTYFGRVDREDAQFLQQVAWDTVRKFDGTED